MMSSAETRSRYSAAIGHAICTRRPKQPATRRCSSPSSQQAAAAAAAVSTPHQLALGCRGHRHSSSPTTGRSSGASCRSSAVNSEDRNHRRLALVLPGLLRVLHVREHVVRVLLPPLDVSDNALEKHAIVESLRRPEVDEPQLSLRELERGAPALAEFCEEVENRKICRTQLRVRRRSSAQGRRKVQIS